MAYMCSCSYERTGIQSGYIYAFHVLNVRCSGEMTSQKSNMGTTNYISILYGKRVWDKSISIIREKVIEQIHIFLFENSWYSYVVYSIHIIFYK